MGIIESNKHHPSTSRGEPWHWLQHDDLSLADLPTDTLPELCTLIAALLSANLEARIDSNIVCMHLVIACTCTAMEWLLKEVLHAGKQPFTASLLAGTPVGFLEKVLSHHHEVMVVTTNADTSEAEVVLGKVVIGTSV